jgi:hypothetical protein
VFRLLGFGLVRALVAWLFYLALEPAVRRRRPRAAIAWSRLLRGGIRDPLVARETLIGLAVGAAIAAPALVECRLRIAAGDPTLFSQFAFGAGMTGNPLLLLNAWASAVAVLLLAAFVPLLVFVSVRALLRHERTSELVAIAISTGLLSLPIDPRLLGGILLAAAVTVLALRVGVVAAFACLAIRPVLLATPYTLDPRSFYFVNAPLAIALLGGLAVVAWWTVRGGARRRAPVLG